MVNILRKNMKNITFFQLKKFHFTDIKIAVYHYANMSVQYTAIFHGYKNGNFQMKKCDFFSFFCSKHRSWVNVRTASLKRF